MCKQCKAAIDFTNAFRFMYETLENHDVGVSTAMMEISDLAEAHLEEECIQICKHPMHMILSAFEEKGKWQQMREGREIQS